MVMFVPGSVFSSVVDTIPLYWAYLDPGTGSMMLADPAGRCTEQRVFREILDPADPRRAAVQKQQCMKTQSLSTVSFRDPAGFVYSRHGELLRQVNQVYREHYDRLVSSGLYDELVQAGLLVRHEELSHEGNEPDVAYKVLRPERVEFISYPGEWSFSACAMPRF